MIALLGHSRNGQGRPAWQASTSVSRHLWLAVTVVGLRPPAAGRRRSLQLVLLPLLAFAKALRDRRSSCDQRGLVREPLGKVGVILLHDVEYGFLGKPSMVLGKESVQVSELFVVHGHRASVAIPKIYRNLLISCQLSTRLVTCPAPCREAKSDGDRCRGHADIGGALSSVNHLLTIAA